MGESRGSVEATRAWRCGVLRSAGFGPELAVRLAEDPAIDLHAHIRLAERGCPPELAVRILAPLSLGDETR